MARLRFLALFHIAWIAAGAHDVEGSTISANFAGMDVQGSDIKTAAPSSKVDATHESSLVKVDVMLADVQSSADPGNLWVLAIVAGVLVAFLFIIVSIFTGRLAEDYNVKTEFDFVGNNTAAPPRFGTSEPRTQRASRYDDPMARNAPQPPVDRIGAMNAAVTSSSATPQSPEHSPNGGLPLCPSLCVPAENRLRVNYENMVRYERQSLTFNVCSATSDQVPLFQIKIEEKDKLSAIFVTKLDGTELAHVTTEDVYHGGRYSGLSLYRNWGALFGTVQPSDKENEYIILRGRTPLLHVTGDFNSMRITVRTASGVVAGQSSVMANGRTDLEVQAGHDAGLIMLSLLAIDKMRGASRRPSVAPNAAQLINV